MKQRVTLAVLISLVLSACCCPTYTYRYRCLQDGEHGVAVTPAVYNVGDTLVSPKSGHKIVITENNL